MKFNKSNTVEEFVFHKVSGYKIAATLGEQDSKMVCGKAWVNKAPQDLKRSINEVLLEDQLHKNE